MSSESKAKNTIADIIAQRDKARTAIFTAEAALDTQIQAIKDNGFSRPLTAGEISDIGRLFAAIGALAGMEQELAFVTVRSLNESAEAKRLANVVDGLNKTLKEKLDDVKDIATKVGKVGSVIKQVDGVLADVLKLLKVFGI